MQSSVNSHALIYIIYKRIIVVVCSGHHQVYINLSKLHVITDLTLYLMCGVDCSLSIAHVYISSRAIQCVIEPTIRVGTCTQWKQGK